MKQHKRITSIIVLCCLAVTCFSQVTEIPPALLSKLAGKKKYGDVMKEVDNYFKANNFNNNPQLFKEYKRWNRWAWFAARHINELGEVDYKASKYFDEAKKIKDNQLTNSPNGVASTAGNWSSIGPTTTSWGLQGGSRGIGRIDRLAINPNNPLVILAGSPSGGLWRTNDGGISWFSITAYLPNCGIAGMVFDNNDPSGNTIYILTGQKVAGNFLIDFGLNRNSLGVLLTTNGGTTWSKVGNSETVLRNRVPQKLLQMRNSSNVLFAATFNGLFSSRDFGATWGPVVGAGFTILDIEQHPVNDSIIYAAGVNGIFRSANFGQSFQFNSTYTPAIFSSGRAQIAVTPANPNDVYYLQLGTDPSPNPTGIVTNTIFQSVNSGVAFTRINTQDLTVNQKNYNYAFAVNPANRNFMAAAGLSLTSSNNNGNTFGNVTIGNTNNPAINNYLHSDIHDLVYTPNGALLYAACDGGVFVSTDNGVTWADRSAGLQCTQYYHMEGFEGTENLYIGGTQDNGTHYTTNGSHMVYSGAGDGFVSDFINTDSRFFYQVENTNVSRFDRSTNSWVGVSPGFGPTRTFYPDVICHPTQPGTVYVSYKDTIWRSFNYGAIWTNVSNLGNNDGTTATTRGYNGGFAVNANMPSRLYAANANTIRRSENEGTSWTTISGTPGWPATTFTITDIATRSNNANEVWVTTTGFFGLSRILYSSNAGANWTDFTASLPNVPVYSIFCTSQGDVYCGTELGVYFMDFAMNDWLPFYNGLPMIPVTDLFVNEAANSISAATWGRGIWRSDLYNDCSPLVVLSSDVNGRFAYQSSGTLESSQKMLGTYNNELRYRSAGKIVLKNNFKAKDGSYFHGIIGPCGQGVFNKTDGGVPKTKAEILNLKTD